MHDPPRPIYLSPHLDDAVLSCGGLIHQQVQHGLRPLVITCFAGVPDYRQLSAFAAEQHRRWGQPSDAVAQRRHEDCAALACLGAEHVHVDYLDCIYRRHPMTGEFLYAHEEALWGPIPRVETALVSELAARLGQALSAGTGRMHRSTPTPAPGVHIFAPLAVGQHVDHRLVLQAALHLRRSGFEVRFYEDYPYAENAQQLAVALQRWSSPPLATVHVLSHDDLQAKIAAICQYTSQVTVLFGAESAVAERVGAYALSVGGNGAYGERYWEGGED